MISLPARERRDAGTVHRYPRPQRGESGQVPTDNSRDFIRSDARRAEFAVESPIEREFRRFREYRI